MHETLVSGGSIFNLKITFVLHIVRKKVRTFAAER